MYITAFPCNQFDLQEPAENHEILNGIKYVRPGGGYQPSTNLHIYGKLDVNGKNGHPMYKFLKNACPPTGDVLGEMKYFYWDEMRTNDIVWNFEKFIVDRQGRPMYRFHPGAWDGGRFVEKFLKQVFETDQFDEYDGAGRPLSAVDSPSDFVVQNTTTSDVNNTNETSSTVRPSTTLEVLRKFHPIPEPVPEPSRGRQHG